MPSISAEAASCETCQGTSATQLRSASAMAGATGRSARIRGSVAGIGSPPKSHLDCRPAAPEYYTPMAKNPKPPDQPTVTFWGAARTVTGSMHRVDACGRAVLLDCGLFQGPRAESRVRNSQFPFRPKEIDAVLLSHAHIDHCGNLPNLVRQGFTGPIYCTPATRALAGVMLGDAAKIQEEDAAYVNRHREKGEPPVEPLYTDRDVYRTLLKLKAVPYDRPVDVAPGLEATFVE